MVRSSRPEVFCNEGVFKNFIKFTEKLLRSTTLLEKDSNVGVFLWILRNVSPVAASENDILCYFESLLRIDNLMLLITQCIELNDCRPEQSFFLSPDRLAARNDVTSDKVNFWLDMRQSFFLKKILTSRDCAALKTTWNYCGLINNKRR